jgi:uncharacterized protein (TIGR02266 family)
MPEKCVIVADDTAFVRERFCAALAEAGHRAAAVRTAGELLQEVRTRGAELDLILLDLHLPHSRGVDLVRSIRSYDGGRTAILVFSGTILSADEVRELAALGVAGYINEYCGAQHIMPSLAPHLFPDNFNRRTSPRVPVSVPVSYRLRAMIASAVTLNVGKGGLAVRTMTPPERSAAVRVRFRLPGAPRDVEADARVRWTDRNLGMGLQFEHLSPADQAIVDAFVDEHFFQSRKT